MKPLIRILGLMFFAGFASTAFSQPILPFTVYPGNPVLAGDPGTWDAAGAFIPTIIQHDSLYYMFYNGSVAPHLAGSPLYIGYATSGDGYQFAKSAANPILTGDGSGFDAWQVTKAVVAVDDSQWVMYYCGRGTPGIGPGRYIGRATAPHPAGPWTRSDTALIKPGVPGEWDSGFVGPQSILPTDSGWVMYYMAGDNQDFLTHDTMRIGMATSTDGGLTWRKYNDPATAAPPYQHSDPVLQPGPDDWERQSVSDCAVIKTGSRFEMFYTGSYTVGFDWFGSIGYAWSEDGIHWTKDSINNPIFTLEDDPLAAGWVEAPTVMIQDNTYFMYYFDGSWSFTHLATAPGVTGIDINLVEGNIPAGIVLKQNYPNPFNPTTTIEFSLSTTELLKLRIYNSLGELVATLFSGKLSLGNYRYNWNAEGLPSGIYFFRIETDRYAAVKKALLLR